MRPPEDPRSAPATLAIVAITAGAWLVAWLTDFWRALFELSFYPARVGGFGAEAFALPVAVTPLTATLVHLNFIHLLFNLTILLVCGRPVERALGGTGVVVLYLVGAYAAAAATYAVDPGSQAPMAGAGAAVSAVLGAFALLFGRNKVKVARPGLGTFVYILWIAAAWIGFQLLIVLTFQSAVPASTIAANIGGFIAGLALARPLLLLKWRGA
jgi:membrane associated rhomboid family serine protease